MVDARFSRAIFLRRAVQQRKQVSVSLNAFHINKIQKFIVLFSDTGRYPLLKVPTKIREAATYEPSYEDIFWSWVSRNNKNYSYSKERREWTNLDISLPRYIKQKETTTTTYLKTKTVKIGYGRLIKILLVGLLWFFFLSIGEAQFVLWFCLILFQILGIVAYWDEIIIVNNEKVGTTISKSSKELEQENIRFTQESIQYKKDYNYYLQRTKEDKEYVERELKYELKLIKKEYFIKSLTAKSKPDRNPNPVVRGKLELDFLSVLHNKFKDKILCDQRIRAGNEYFYPDFVLYDHYNELYIDIEIDEPYSLLHNQPIHYQNSGDISRDKYFLENNWAVIRFTEKQIAEYPLECLKLVQDFKKAIENKEPFIKINIPEENVWSYEQALLWSKENYRNTYSKV